VSPSRLVTVYSRPGCHLCEQAISALRRLQTKLDFEIRERDIGGDARLLRAYFDRIPVVELDGVELCDCVLDEELVRDALRAASA
jgi:glutaredoxin